MAEDAEQGAHQDEYHDGMVELLELVWGKGFLSPGGPDNVKETVAGLDLADKLVLDIGCGIGGPALVLAGERHGGRPRGAGAFGGLNTEQRQGQGQGHVLKNFDGTILMRQAIQVRR